VLGELLTALVTPFREDGSVDVDRFRAHARRVVDEGSDGVVVAATTGESPTLTDEEKLALFEAAVEEMAGKATVVAATGTYATAHSVHLTEKAHDLGVDGFLVVTPYYNKPPQRGIVEHFRAIAAATDRPIMVYNIPGRVVVNIEPATMVELAQIPNVLAVKQALDELDQAQRIVEEAGLDLYAGDDFLLFPFLELGGVGGVCVRSNLAAPQMKEMITRYREGDVEGARRINEDLQPLWDLDGVAVNPIPVKTALSLLGQDMGAFRLPLVEATPTEASRVRDCLERAGLLTATPA